MNQVTLRSSVVRDNLIEKVSEWLRNYVSELRNDPGEWRNATFEEDAEDLVKVIELQQKQEYEHGLELLNDQRREMARQDGHVPWGNCDDN